MAFATVPADDFQIERGVDLVGTIDSTGFGERRFCTRCGSPLTISVRFQADTIDFSIATLDAPDAVPPGFHIFIQAGSPGRLPLTTSPGTTGFAPTPEAPRMAKRRRGQVPAPICAGAGSD